jgi:hydroxyacylglutathione hydrolase
MMKFDSIPVTRVEQNCSILHCEATRKAAVIDCGGDIHLILDYLEWEELDLEVILSTHGHFDHSGATAALAARTGARIEGPHIAEAATIASIPEHAARFGFKGESFTPGRWLADGDKVRFGEEELSVLHCPGHTRGHVVYFHESERVAFVGDILFRHAIGAWQHGDGDLRLLVDSIRNKLFPLGDDVRFVPGHGEMSSFGHERRENPFVGDAAMELWQRKVAG